MSSVSGRHFSHYKTGAKLALISHLHALKTSIALAKVISFDVVRQTLLSAGEASVDAAICYDSMAHAIASSTCQAFGVPAEAVHSMLATIEDMKYYLRTAYGESKNFRGNKIAVKFQGLCQGNGASPAA